MKFIKWKTLAVTCLVCLLPILLGLYLWDQLPETIATHFDINNNPDGFSSKAFAVFGLPILMAALQIICCLINDFNAMKHGDRKKFEMVTKWIIPVLSIVLEILTFAYALGYAVDIRKCVIIIIGIMFIVLGNYMPKFDYIKNYDLSKDKARKINRFIGFETVVMGVLGILTIFLPPIFSLCWLILLIPYALIAVVYGIVVGKSK